MNFGPDAGQGDDDDDTGGSAVTGGTGNGTSGSSPTAGANASGGTDSDEGGAGSSAGGSEAAGTDSGGSTSGGTGAGGAGGTNVSGSGGAGGSAGTGNESGTGGNGGSGTGSGGTGGGGAAGNGGAGGSGPVTCTTNNYFLGHNYAFCTEVDSAMAGYEKCQSLGMSVVTIESKQENAYVLEKQKGDTWLGGTDEGHEKDWIWSTGVYFTKNDKPVQGVYSNWLEGQPNNDNKDGLNENCLVMTSTGGWNDLACTLGGSKVTCESSGPSIPPMP